MLRIEQGFDPSVYESSDEGLAGYTDYHRLLMPNLIAADIRINRDADPLGRLNGVVNGLTRSATLAIELDDMMNAPQNQQWQQLKDATDLSAAADNAWRVARREGGHATYPGFVVWSATRTLASWNERTDGDDHPRLRERYTFTSSEDASDNDMMELLVHGETPHEIILATATVYAINKAVKKTGYVDSTDYSKYSEVKKALTSTRKRHS